MVEKKKIYKALDILFSIFGGWWGLMSGIPSIPLYFAGLYFFHGTEKDWFWTGAFICLWILVIRMGWRNYELTNAQNKASEMAAKKREIRTEFTRLHGELRIARQLIEMDMGAYQARFDARPDPVLGEIFSQIHKAFIEYFDGSKYVLFEDDSGFPNLEIKQRGTAMAEKTVHRLNQYIIRLGKIVEDNEVGI